MADEDKGAVDKGIEADGGQQKADDSQTSVDKAELERLKANDARMSDLDRIAKEASTEDETLKAEDYLNHLEDAYYEQSQAKPETKQETKTEESKTAEPTKAEVTPTPDPNAEEAKRIALQSQQNSNTALLAVQYSEYRDSQRDLPEDQRSSLTKADLQKMIMSREDQPTITAVAKKKFDGNFYAAANYIHALMNADDLITKARKEGANSEAAKEAARVSAQLPGNVGRVAEPENKSAVQKAQEENDRQADLIAPDTEYVPQA